MRCRVKGLVLIGLACWGWSLEYMVFGVDSSRSQATGTILTLGLLNISMLCFVVLRCLLGKADKVASDVPWFL